MNSLAGSFNRSGLSKFINRPEGRIFRIVMGLGFIIVGYIFKAHVLGIISIVWGFLPLTAGLFDGCWVSFALGGPFSGKKIREFQSQV